MRTGPPASAAASKLPLPMRPTHLVTLPLLCVLLPLSAMGQAPEPDSAQVPPPPPLISAPEEPTPEAPPEPEPPEGELIPWEYMPSSQGDDPRRVRMQILGGLAASAGTLLTVYGLYSLDSQTCDGFFCNPDLFFAGLGIAAFGLSVGPPIAVWLIGEHYDDRGRFWPALGGGALGTLASVLSLVALSGHVPAALNIGLVGVWPVVGTMLLYEYTRARSSRGIAASGLRVLPVVSLSQRGSIVGGLAGSF
jgi:hypothetical protein